MSFTEQRVATSPKEVVIGLESNRKHFPVVMNQYEFLTDLRERLSQARKNIYSLTFDFDRSHATGLISNQLRRVSERGIPTIFGIAEYGVITTNDRLNFWDKLPFIGSRFQRLIRRINDEEVRSMEELKIEIPIIRPERKWWKFWHIYCQNHMKMLIVDQYLYWLTLNITGGSFESAESVVRLDNPEIVNPARRIITKIYKGDLHHSQRIKCTEDYEIIVDAGLSGNDSLIYEAALQLVESEQESLKACAMLPYSGKLLKKCIELARKGVPVEIIMTDPDNPILKTFPYNISYKRFLKKIKNEPNIHLYHYPGIMHAKIVLGSEQCLIGSHNLDEWLVKFLPPDEIQMLARDKSLIDQLKIQFEEFKQASHEYIQQGRMPEVSTHFPG